MQNKSQAVMAQRHEPLDSPDDFPTPPWATRALLDYVIVPRQDVSGMRCLEPACGEGHMAKVLQSYFKSVYASDKYSYQFGNVRDFLGNSASEPVVDWTITNPPFRQAEEFIRKALTISKRGVAMLTRTTFLESVGRYERLFSVAPPNVVAQFSERVPMVRGKLDARASTATGYCWLVWLVGDTSDTVVEWIPPCRKALEQFNDYADASNETNVTSP